MRLTCLLLLSLGYVSPALCQQSGLDRDPAARNTLRSEHLASNAEAGVKSKIKFVPPVSESPATTGSAFWLVETSNDLSAARVLQFFSANRIANENFEKSVAQWRHWSAARDEQMHWRSRCSRAGGCLYFAASERKSSLLFSNNFKIEKSKSYLVKFRIAASFPQTKVKTRVRRDGPAYESLGLDKRLTVGIRWKEYEFLISATQDSHIARLELEVAAGDQILLDNVSVQAVAAEVGEPADDNITLVRRDFPSSQGGRKIDLATAVD